MKNFIQKFIFLVLLILPCVGMAQPRVIFDTDIDSDVDDAWCIGYAAQYAQS